MTLQQCFQNELAILRSLCISLPGQSTNQSWWVSLDEVGRGSVAGPVVACATLWVMAPSTDRKAESQVGHLEFFQDKIQDSKRLSEKNRILAAEGLLQCLNDSRASKQKSSVGTKTLVQSSGLSWQSPRDIFKPKKIFAFEKLTTTASPLEALKHPPTVKLIEVSIGSASSKEIDAFNIWEATQLAISRALGALRLEGTQGFILFDGKLASKVPDHCREFPFVTAVRGDARFKSVAASSILAKVFRDQQMLDFETRYPGYQLGQNKGYGTSAHLQAIIEHGFSDEHRRSFLSRVIHSKEPRLNSRENVRYKNHRTKTSIEPKRNTAQSGLSRELSAKQLTHH